MKPQADRIAEIIIPEGIDKRGRPSRIGTAYGQKTREGISALILAEMEPATEPLKEALYSCLIHTAAMQQNGRPIKERQARAKDLHATILAALTAAGYQFE